MSYPTPATIADLLGKTLTAVTHDGDDSLTFTTVEGERFQMYHRQDCCESVYIESITGDLQDLVGHPILMAEENSSNELPPGVEPPAYRDDIQEWTFYKLATIKGYVDIRWYGSSNGYYSTSVDFEKLPS